MSRVFIIVVASLVAPLLVHAAPAALKAGEPFVKARKQIYAAGWRADPLAHLSSGEYSGVERLLVERGYTEVDSCSEGLSFCIFQYTRGDACLRLQTQGEQIRLMKVDRWSSECRERRADEEEIMPPADVRYLIQWWNDCELAGECQKTNRFLLKLKRKYAHDPAIMQILRSAN
ncbi:hypothetical protein [Duganella qianjiadongensis]|uniref:Uncharacterized protein n=1 Tax=Duganella qianjiadongensis TaxID=2692176 RepID=A0ABW9VRI1_9BURK|nr:hypothetical protein [Duganella qianjiadongensis]MYM41185.1 hypothetical protein [Duganella qianjiadongensis]